MLILSWQCKEDRLLCPSDDDDDKIGHKVRMQKRLATEPCTYVLLCTQRIATRGVLNYN